MSVERAAKVYLQNRLTRCRSKHQELEPVLTSKRKCGTLGPPLKRRLNISPTTIHLQP